MAYAIQFKPAALRQFEKLSRGVQKRIAARIVDLSDDAFPPGCKKLSSVPDAWRIRVGDYRVVYQVRREILLVLVLAVGHRRDVYR
jgi:mRNA interferase RelE/StbE